MTRFTGSTRSFVLNFTTASEFQRAITARLAEMRKLRDDVRDRGWTCEVARRRPATALGQPGLEHRFGGIAIRDANPTSCHHHLGGYDRVEPSAI